MFEIYCRRTGLFFEHSVLCQWFKRVCCAATLLPQNHVWMQFSVHRVIRAMTYSCYFTEQLNQLSTHVPVMPKVIQLPHTALFCHVILVNHCFDHAICRSVCMMSLHLGPIKVNWIHRRAAAAGLASAVKTRHIWSPPPFTITLSTRHCTRANNQNGISIDSAVSAQLTT